MSRTLKAIEPKWLLVFVFFISGIFLGGVVIYLWSGMSGNNVYTLRLSQGAFKYISPLLGVESQNNSLVSANKSIELKIQGAVNEVKSSGKAIDASVYFRDLKSGYWTGVNEDAKFSPGRLLKMPLMIAYFKLAESDPKILEKQIVAVAEPKEPNNISPASDVVVTGETYTVQELLNRMMTKSDDAAADLLFDNIDKNVVNGIFSDLGIDFKEDKNTTSYISLKLNSLFFRVLHNATYLNREYSEKALALLDQPEDNTALGASIPKEISFVNRMGRRQYIEGGKTIYQIYDCGIVYYPEYPYLLCASVKSYNETNAEEFLKNLGIDIYDEVDYKYKK